MSRGFPVQNLSKEKRHFLELFEGENENPGFLPRFCVRAINRGFRMRINHGFKPRNPNLIRIRLKHRVNLFSLCQKLSVIVSSLEIFEGFRLQGLAPEQEEAQQAPASEQAQASSA